MHEREKALKDAAEMLWVVLANVSGGDWTKQSQEWQEAAARWRDNYFGALASLPPGDAPQPCPHCKLPPTMPDVCTPELNAVIEEHIEVERTEPIEEPKP
jgi:hypothetical protein